MVSPASHKLTGVRGTQDAGPAHPRCLYGIVTLFDRSFQNVRVQECAMLPVLQPQPWRTTAGLGCSRFARHYFGNLMLISFRWATEMFQFTHYPPTCLYIQQAVSRHHAGGVAPFGFSGIIACVQLPRNVSPVSASFIGLQCRGIHLVLDVACSCSLLSSHPALASDLRLGGGIRSSSASLVALRQN